MLLRRRSCSGPLLLIGLAVCLFYQTLMVARNRLRLGGQQPVPDVRSRKLSDEEIGGLVSALDTLQAQVSLPAGCHPVPNTDIIQNMPKVRLMLWTE